MPPAALDLSVIVVNYNTRKLLEDCLRSLETHLDGRLDYEVVAVDNASSDGSAEWLRAHAETRPRVRAVCSRVNTGFSGGNNLGLRLASGRNILLFNSDAYLVDASLVEAAAWLDAQADVFSVACMLLTGDGGPGPSYGHFPTPATLARELVTRRFAQLRAVCPAPSEPTHDVDFPCGAFYLIKGSLLREVGEMDEAFFMYFEETDLAKRARDRGYRSVYFGAARAVHLGGQSTQEVKSAEMTRMFYRNWRRYLDKHHGPAASALVRAMLGLHFASAAAYQRLRGRRKAAAFSAAHLRAVRAAWAE